jgi:hypothetical protein
MSVNYTLSGADGRAVDGEIHNSIFKLQPSEEIPGIGG